MIHAVFFDLDHTLFDRATAHRRYCVDFQSRHAAAFPEPRRAADLEILAAGVEDPAWGRRAFGHRAANAFPGLGLSAAAIAADHAARLPAFIDPEPAVILLIEALTGRYRTAVLSNGSGPVQRAKLDRTGLADSFGRVFISGDAGTAKPAPALFLRALTWSGCDPGAALFVGDDPVADIAGAAAVGMRTCWVARGRDYPRHLRPPNLTIDRIGDLARVLP